MKPLPVDVLATAMNASVNAALEVTGIQATGFAIDSRHITPGDVFCALEGERVDGHDFAAEAIAAGAVAIITNRDIADVPCLVTDNSLEALGRLAHWYRTHELSATVIAVTGSSGKTTTKDLIADVLPGAVVAARGSFNTEVGVPLTILEADPSTDYLVLEMGMRGIGHIAYLAEMAEPDIGVVLNVGLAHVGMMNGPEEIARAKSELVRALSAKNVAVLNCDDFAVSAMAEQSDAPVVWFGERIRWGPRHRCPTRQPGAGLIRPDRARGRQCCRAPVAARRTLRLGRPGSSGGWCLVRHVGQGHRARIERCPGPKSLAHGCPNVDAGHHRDQ